MYLENSFLLELIRPAALHAKGSCSVGQVLNRSSVQVVAAFADLGTTIYCCDGRHRKCRRGVSIGVSIRQLYEPHTALVDVAELIKVETSSKVRNCRQPEELYTLNHHSCTFPGYGVISVPSAQPSVPTPTDNGCNKEKDYPLFITTMIPLAPTFITFITYLVICGCKQNKCCSKCS